MKKYDIGYTCGVFDLFHIGHLLLLERCKAMCNTLVVGICNDDYVINVKHKCPVYPEEHRLRIVNALKVVDKAELVTIAEIMDKRLAYDRFHFDVLFSGDDWKGSERFNKTEEELKEIGVSVVFFSYTKGISSSQIKQDLIDNEK